eukprot:1118699-Rhodomonas_salina.3
MIGATVWSVFAVCSIALGSVQCARRSTRSGHSAPVMPSRSVRTSARQGEMPSRSSAVKYAVILTTPCIVSCCRQGCVRRGGVEKSTRSVLGGTECASACCTKRCHCAVDAPSLTRMRNGTRRTRSRKREHAHAILPRAARSARVLCVHDRMMTGMKTSSGRLRRHAWCDPRLCGVMRALSLIHISEPTRPRLI